MRRADREVTDVNEIYDIIRGCDTCCIALNGEDGFPYVIPMNFGFEVNDGKPVIYLHCAKEGKKLDLIRDDGRCAFTMSRGHSLLLGKAACASAWLYESACGRGHISIIEGDEGIKGLVALMKKYDPDRVHVFDERHLKAVTMLRLDIEQLTGKRRQAK